MRPDETAVPPAVGSLALSPSLQGLFLCRLPYPLLRVSSSCLCPVSLAPFSLFSFPFPLFSCVSVSPCLSSGLSASPYSLHFPLLSPPSTFSDFYLTLSFSSLRLSALLSVHFLFSSPPLHLTSPLLPLGDAGRNRIRKIPDFIAGRFLRSVFRLRCKCSKFSVIMIS